MNFELDDKAAKNNANADGLSSVDGIKPLTYTYQPEVFEMVNNPSLKKQFNAFKRAIENRGTEKSFKNWLFPQIKMYVKIFETDKQQKAVTAQKLDPHLIQQHDGKKD